MRSSPAKVLIITYYWPPSGGAGVQRWLKFAKYLPSSGWLPVVLTVQPEYAAYPFTDISLFDDIPIDVEVVRTKATNYFFWYSKNPENLPSAGFARSPKKNFKEVVSRFIRGNLFIPDPRRGWNKFAFRKACNIITEQNINHIITTSPPHSTQLIGLRLKKKFPHIKWIADLRDPWTDIYYYDMFYPSPIARQIDKYYERSVLKRADLITTVGYRLGQQFEAKVPGTEDKISVIHNGYDDSDFQNITVSVPPRFTISFTGTLSESYPLTGFAEAVKSILGKGQDLLVRFTGAVSDEQRQQLINYLGSDHLEFIRYTDHHKVIEQMISSSILLLVIAQHKDNSSFLSGKLFEYIASGRPILCLGPVEGDASRILEHHNYGKCFDYSDTGGIESFISFNMANPSQSRKSLPVEYTRRHLAEQVAKLL